MRDAAAAILPTAFAQRDQRLITRRRRDHHAWNAAPHEGTPARSSESVIREADVTCSRATQFHVHQTETQNAAYARRLHGAGAPAVPAAVR